ncbi:hypothetical protein Fot_44721 [Forsythia ovata]|uniref:Uncharacterized protein n=1 Tax=Forsythia ovata TaxID=205694 RepID=A0ABD1R5F3_9LAMI
MDKSLSSPDHDEDAEMRPSFAYFLVVSTNDARDREPPKERVKTGQQARKKPLRNVSPAMRPSLSQMDASTARQLDKELTSLAHLVTNIQSRFREANLKMLRLVYDIPESVQLRVSFAQ